MRKPILRLPHGVKPLIKQIQPSGLWLCEFKGIPGLSIAGIADEPQAAYNSLWNALREYYSIEFYHAP